MSLAMVLDLDPLQVRSVHGMVERGLLRAGRPTPRGAYLYELTNEGVTVLESVSERDATEAFELAEACAEGECEYGQEVTSLQEELQESRDRVDKLLTALRLAESILTVNVARIQQSKRPNAPAYLTEALAALREGAL